MTRTQSLGVLGVLLVVMVAVYARALRPQPARRAAGSDAQATEAVVAPAQPRESSEAVILLALPQAPLPSRAPQRERARDLAWERDPFSLGTSGAAVSGLELSGILWDPTAPVAILNGQMVHVGQECEGYRIVEIAKDRVTVTDGAETFSLSITP